jgi:hypothetical protein
VLGGVALLIPLLASQSPRPSDWGAARVKALLGNLPSGNRWRDCLGAWATVGAAVRINFPRLPLHFRDSRSFGKQPNVLPR